MYAVYGLGLKEF